jgi:hypothetical protein
MVMAVSVADAAFDPRDLPAQDMIRYAERLIRAHHRFLDNGWLFWGNLADHLNFIAHVPDKTAQRDSDWREFNRAQELALGYIEITLREGRRL